MSPFSFGGVEGGSIIPFKVFPVLLLQLMVFFFCHAPSLVQATSPSTLREEKDVLTAAGLLRRNVSLQLPHAIGTIVYIYSIVLNVHKRRQNLSRVFRTIPSRR